MTVKEFIDGVDTTNDLDTYLSERINNNYVDFTKKVDICSRVIDATSKVIVDKETTFRINSPARYMLFTLNLIDLYTDIDIDFKKGTECFNTLDSIGAIEHLINRIPEREVKNFQMIHDMVMNDMMENTRSLVGYLDNKMTAFKIAMNELTKVTETADAE